MTTHTRVEDALTEPALAAARKMIRATVSPVEWGTPVLYLRAEDGRLFDLAPDPAAPAFFLTDGVLSLLPLRRRVEADSSPGQFKFYAFGGPHSANFSLFFRIEGISGKRRSKKAIRREVSARGRLTKMSRPPWEMIKDCRSAVSRRGPKMKARMKGPPS